MALNVNKLHYLLGKWHLEAGRLKEAVSEWTAYLDPRPDDAELKREVAKLHCRLALAEFAKHTAPISKNIEDDLRQAAAMDPENSIYPYYLALRDLHDRKWDSFISTAETLLPGLDSAMQLHAKYHLGLAWLAKKHPEKATPFLAEVGASTSQSDLELDAGFLLAVVHATAGRWNEAVTMLNLTKEECA